MIPTFCYGLACFALGYYFRPRIERARQEKERSFAAGRRSERAEALREQAENARPFVMMTSGDGSRERPFTRHMHHAQCGAWHARACDCELLIAEGGRR